MLFWNGSKMVSKPDTVAVLPSEETQAITKSRIPQITTASVIRALESYQPKQVTWGPNSFTTAE